MKKITIINAYGDKNLGDAAILRVAVDFIYEAYENKCRLSALSESGEVKTSLGAESSKISSYQLPYGFAIRSNSGKVSEVTKITRFMTIFFGSFFFILLDLLFKRNLPQTGFFSYIYAIKQAELIVGIGGGYFITKSMKDYFGLLLTLLPVYVAKIYRRKIIFLPISFGPFAFWHQEWLCYQLLRKTTIMARDYITLKQIRRNDTHQDIKSFFIPDLALFLKPKMISLAQKMKSKYITLTAREWLPTQEKQAFYEKSLSEFINKVWSKYKLKTIFVVMSKNKAEDDDNDIAKRIAKNVIRNQSYEIVNPKDIDEAQNIYAKARLAICTRMHSAIFSSTVLTPFIPIGYGHKTKGFVQNLKITKWFIDISEVNSLKLQKLFTQLIKPKLYSKFSNQLVQTHKSNLIYRDRIIKEIYLN